MTTTNTDPFQFEFGSIPFYVVVGAGSVMSFLLFIILVLCVAIGCLAARRKRQSYAITAAPPQGQQNPNGHGEERQVPNQQQQLRSQGN